MWKIGPSYETISKNSGDYKYKYKYKSWHGHCYYLNLLWYTESLSTEDMKATATEVAPDLLSTIGQGRAKM